MAVIKNQYAGGFNEFMGRYRALFIKEFFSKGKIGRIVDIGCGPGDVIAELDKISPLVRKSRNVTMIDPDRRYLNIAKKRFDKSSKFNFIESTFENLQLGKEYDLMIMIDLLEHVDDPRAVLKNAKKHLSDSGRIVIIVPNAKSLHRFIGREEKFIKKLDELGPADFKVGHQRCFDYERLERLAIKCGLRVAGSSGILLKPFPNSRMEGLTEKHCDMLYMVGKEIPRYCAELAVVLSR